MSCISTGDRTFDEMVELIGEEKITIKDYVSLIETGLTQIKMGQTPPSVDQIIVGDLSRTRFREVDYVFVLGVNEGKVPLVRASNRLLTDHERSTLFDLGLELAPNQQKSLFKEQMNIYMGLTRGRKLLHVSYARVLEEKSERPATLVFLLRKMFPTIETQLAEDIIKNYDRPTRCYALFNRLVRLSGSLNLEIMKKKSRNCTFSLIRRIIDNIRLGLIRISLLKGLIIQTNRSS